MVDFNERTKLAIELVILAGKEIKRICDEEDIQTKGKDLNVVVTIADVESEKISCFSLFRSKSSRGT